ncbi:hypothetical protein [Aminobacterium sp. EBM-42]|jgi:hypothetical protein|nr:hypothetical protein [Aminobacterium sp. EBM-42]
MLSTLAAGNGVRGSFTNTKIGEKIKRQEWQYISCATIIAHIKA